MKEDGMLMCLIAFVLGYLVARMMRGNGFTLENDYECIQCYTEFFKCGNKNHCKNDFNKCTGKKCYK